MNAYLLAVLVIDHDQMSVDAVADTIEDQKYPNRCIYPYVLGREVYNIGEWDDDHPLNQRDTDVLAWLKANGRKVSP